ncbi:MAG: M20/M25/M40 family metallo-hydrolase [Candidatus Lambdaproteobacteria bacterium]|nr:M20/M25/M40 family metallo-hydrolase [Candidatus Lambdaproteobacteria bacterium]
MATTMGPALVWIIRGIALLLMVAAAFVIVLVVKTVWIGGPLVQPRDTVDIPSEPDPASLRQSQLRLAEAVRIRTVSHGAGMPVEERALLNLHRMLAGSFPLVHATLKRELINGLSLLYTWQGSNPHLKPMLLAAHLDVVPVEPGTERHWTHPPFAGVIADGYIWGRGTLDMKV